MDTMLKNSIRVAFIIAKRATSSTAFFPAILTLVLILLSGLSISGSSIGIYHQIFYGDTPDSNLLVNRPQTVRSDEWVVSAEKTIAQSNNEYQTINNNVGFGENQSVLVGNPTTDWSTVFRPDNFGFFVLPFDNAFALKWWTSPYLLTLSVYFFVLVFLPKKRLLASIIAVGFLFSPFFQWWGSYMPVALVLLGFVAFTKLLHARKVSHAFLWGGLISYLAVCFALILYPPFQIPAAFVILALAAGYLIDNFREVPRKELIKKLLILLAAGITAIAIFLLFMASHKSVTDIIQGTAYPGRRISTSGGYNLAHLLASQTSGLLQSGKHSGGYAFSPNQSEASNFMLITPYLIVPLIYLVWAGFKKNRRIMYGLLLPLLIGVLFMAWIFVPGLDFVGKITLLSNVPRERIIIGFGILNLISLVLFIRLYQDSKWKLRHELTVIYSLLVLIALLCINFYIAIKLPDFMNFKWAIVVSLPFALIVYLLLRKKYVLSMTVLCVFSFLSICKIQPLYVGTSVLRDTPISKAMTETSNKYNSNQRWVGDYIYLENFPAMNGLPSLVGTYVYPQLDIWSKLNQTDKITVYNRYAHTNFTFNRDPNTIAEPALTNPGTDQLNIAIEPCDPFFKTMEVGYLFTTVPFGANEATCLSLDRTVKYPAVVFYIYRVSL